MSLTPHTAKSSGGPADRDVNSETDADIASATEISDAGVSTALTMGHTVYKVDGMATYRPIPFYGSYAQFQRAMKALKARGLPKRLNPRTLAPILGDEGQRVATHLTAMGWVDDDGVPSAEFSRLVASYETEEWESALKAVVMRSYSFVPSKWEELTADGLHRAFIEYVGRDTKQTLKQAETFFLALALAIGIQLPDRLFLRAQRAHTDAKRSNREEDPDEDNESSVPPKNEKPDVVPVRRAIESDAPGMPKPGMPKKDALNLLLQLTPLLTASDLSQTERTGLISLIGYVSRRASS
jgi:hypothetical protein